MGNSSKKPEEFSVVNSYRPNQWVNIDKKNGYQIWQNSAKRLQADVYPLMRELTTSQLQHYEKRKNNDPDIVQVYHIRIDKQPSLCSKISQAYVFVERIPYRLSNVTTLSQNQALEVLRSSYSGFNTLSTFYGPFQPYEDMICFNHEKKAKVWINSNLAENRVQYKNLDRSLKKDDHLNEAYVQKVFDMVDHKTSPPLPQNLKSKFKQSHPQTYFAALNLIQQYAHDQNIHLSQPVSQQLFEQSKVNTIPIHNVSQYSIQKLSNSSHTFIPKAQFYNSQLRSSLPPKSGTYLRNSLEPSGPFKVNFVNGGQPQLQSQNNINVHNQSMKRPFYSNQNNRSDQPISEKQITIQPSSIKNIQNINNIQTNPNSQANYLQAPARNILFNGNMNGRRVNYPIIPNIGRTISQNQINQQGLPNNFSRDEKAKETQVQPPVINQIKQQSPQPLSISQNQSKPQPETTIKILKEPQSQPFTHVDQQDSKIEHELSVLQQQQRSSLNKVQTETVVEIQPQQLKPKQTQEIIQNQENENMNFNNHVYINSNDNSYDNTQSKRINAEIEQQAKQENKSENEDSKDKQNHEFIASSQIGEMSPPHIDKLKRIDTYQMKQKESAKSESKNIVQYSDVRSQHDHHDEIETLPAFAQQKPASVIHQSKPINQSLSKQYSQKVQIEKATDQRISENAQYSDIQQYIRNKYKDIIGNPDESQQRPRSSVSPYQGGKQYDVANQNEIGNDAGRMEDNINFSFKPTNIGQNLGQSEDINFSFRPVQQNKKLTQNQKQPSSDITAIQNEKKQILPDKFPPKAPVVPKKEATEEDDMLDVKFMQRSLDKKYSSRKSQQKNVPTLNNEQDQAFDVKKLEQNLIRFEESRVGSGQIHQNSTNEPQMQFETSQVSKINSIDYRLGRHDRKSSMKRDFNLKDEIDHQEFMKNNGGYQSPVHRISKRTSTKFTKVSQEIDNIDAKFNKYVNQKNLASTSKKILKPQQENIQVYETSRSRQATGYFGNMEEYKKHEKGRKSSYELDSYDYPKNLISETKQRHENEHRNNLSYQDLRNFLWS